MQLQRGRQKLLAETTDNDWLWKKLYGYKKRRLQKPL